MINRDIYSKIVIHLSEDEITLLTGPRQVGKTTILRQLKTQLEREEAHVILYNLDLETDFFLFRKQIDLINHIRSQIKENSKNYVFIDEIQRKENAGLFLKGLYDLALPVKYVVTGSGSLELKEKIHESLAGRKRIFEIHPISFEEFLKYKWNIPDIEKLGTIIGIEKEKTSLLFLEYLNFGGYPKIVEQNNVADKLQTLEEIFNSFLVRDISSVLKLRNPDVIFTLLQILSDRIGQKVQYNNIASLCGIAVPTLKKYLWYLEKMYIINRINGFSTNKTKEITKAPVYYFEDLGLRNFVLNMNGNIQYHSPGFVFENFVYHWLRTKIEGTTNRIKFWQTKDKAEVDFIIDKFYSQVPVEVKFKKISKVTIPKSLSSFINRYAPPEAWIVNLDYEETILKNRTLVKFIPLHKMIGDLVIA